MLPCECLPFTSFTRNLLSGVLIASHFLASDPSILSHQVASQPRQAKRRQEDACFSLAFSLLTCNYLSCYGLLVTAYLIISIQLLHSVYNLYFLSPFHSFHSLSQPLDPPVSRYLLDKPSVSFSSWKSICKPSAGARDLLHED